jgi:phage shock protein PspC (stress-responsive transcriptional regulator)
MTKSARRLSTTITIIITITLVLGTAASARADEAGMAMAMNYAVASVGTTLGYQPNTGSASGWQHDISPAVGFGRHVTETIALELDLQPTYIRGTYMSFTLMPAAVWFFSTHVYAAARFMVPVDPQVNFALFPGIGVIDRFSNGISVYAELNASSMVGRGNPDLGLAVTGGVMYWF